MWQAGYGLFLYRELDVPRNSVCNGSVCWCYLGVQMNLYTYLGLALLLMEVDALMSWNAKVKFRWIRSLILALIWPITIPCVIGGVIKDQRKLKS